MDIYSIISLILSALMGVFVIVGILYGLIVGFKQSLIAGIYNLALIILLTIFTSQITNFIINFDLSSINLSLGGSATTLKDFIVEAIKANEKVAKVLSDNPGLIDTIMQLPQLIASPFVFVIAFWVIKFVVFVLVGILKMIISIFTIPFKKKKDKRAKKPSKHRLAGMACGLMIGLMAVFASLVPIFGFSSALLQLNEIEMGASSGTAVVLADDTSNSSKETLLESLLGKESARKLIDTYQNNIAVNVSRALGIESLGKIAFNNIASTQINGEEIKLLDDIKYTVEVYNDALRIKELIEKETLTQVEMNEMLTLTNKVINNVFEVKFLSSVGNVVVPIVVDNILEDDENSIIKLPDSVNKDEFKKVVVRKAIENLKNYDFSLLKEVLLNTTSVLNTLNDDEILLPLYNSMKQNKSLSTSDYVALLKDTSSNFATKISNNIFSLSFISDLTPTLVDSGTNALVKTAGGTHTENILSEEKATNVLKTIVENAINLIKSLDPSSELVITENSFTYLGKILNITKNTEVLPTSEYDSIVTFVEDELNSLTNSIGLPVDVSGVIDNISKVDNWETETTKFANSFAELDNFYAEIKGETIDLKTIKLEKAGKLFDKLEKTTLFGGEIQPMFNDMLDTAKSGLSDFESAIDVLKISETTVNWENELKSIQPLISEMLKFADLTLTDAKSTKEIIKLCEKFDAVENDTTSEIYSKKMQPLLIELINVAKNLDPTNSTINDVCNEILIKLNARTNNTPTLTISVERGIFSYANNLIPLPSSFSDTNIQKMIDEIKTNINKVNNGTLSANISNEIDYLLSFSEKINDLKNFENLTDQKKEEMSTFLDSLSDSAILSNCNFHIKNFILDSAINSLSSNKYGLKDCLESLKTSIQGINISTLISDLNQIKDIAPNVQADTSDISSLDTQTLANNLNAVRNLETFPDSFTNTILSNILTSVNSDAQANTNLPDSKKTEIDAYCTEQNTRLETLVVADNNEYKNILDGLKNVFTTI